jgi:ribonuclease D
MAARKSLDRPAASPAPGAPTSDAASAAAVPATPHPPQGYRPYLRSSFRSRSHDDAHLPVDQSPQVDASDLVRHPLITHAAPSFIDTASGLAELVAHLRSAGRFAYDSEFIGERTYVPQLCLIQVATAQRVVLVDSLAGLDLSAFWELLSDPAVEKVVHAGQQDIEPVFRNIARPAANVFDTQICAGFIGLAYPVALSKLVRAVVGARLGKGLTFTQWDQRPLSAMQLRYAADDVRYLLAAREAIGQQLDLRGHAAWARAECDALCDPSQYGFDPATQYQRIRGGGSLQPRNLAILRSLTVWRDELARSHNVPPRTFLRDEVLLDLARTPVKSVDKLARVKGLPRPLVETHGSELIALTAAAWSLPAEQLPPPQRDLEPTPRQRFVAEAMASALHCICAGRGIDPALVASRQQASELFHALAENAPTADLPLLQGWRREAAGQALLNLLSGKSIVELAWADSLIAQSRSVTN